MLRARIDDALKTAMKSQKKHTVATIRLIMAALKDRDIAARSEGNMDGISDDEILSMLQSMIKQRRESGGAITAPAADHVELEVLPGVCVRRTVPPHEYLDHLLLVVQRHGVGEAPHVPYEAVLEILGRVEQ